MDKKKYVYIALGIIALAIAGWVFYPAVMGSTGEKAEHTAGVYTSALSSTTRTPDEKASFSADATTPAATAEATPPPSGTMLRVSVTGNVVYPGAYMATRGETVADLIERAGGLTPGADTSKLDMDKQVYDGEYIGVP